MTVTSRVGDGAHVSRDDIEAKLREIRGEVDSVGGESRNLAVIAGAVLAVAVVGMAYLLGKRKARHKSTIVEIRRV